LGEKVERFANGMAIAELGERIRLERLGTSQEEKRHVKLDHQYQ
jgi:hypothetical protein